MNEVNNSMDKHGPHNGSACEYCCKRPRVVPVEDGVDIGLVQVVAAAADSVDNTEDDVHDAEDGRLVEMKKSHRHGRHHEVEENVDDVHAVGEKGEDAVAVEVVVDCKQN